jgi:L-ribulokinase
MEVNKSFVIGVDFGTDSVRSVLVNTADGAEVSAAIFEYPRWKKQLFCDARKNQFRQHPLDYVEGLEHTIKECIKKANLHDTSSIVGIGVDTTGSTPVAVNQQGVPLALVDGFEGNPNAMFVLWKDHTSIQEADEINRHAPNFSTNYLQYVGGIYSSEWFWAKILHILKEDSAIKESAYTWIEHCDWIPFLLTGKTDVNDIKRSVCAAGHKGLWSDEFGGFPPNEFFKTLNPLLDGVVDTLGKNVLTSDNSAGNLSDEWATRLGLSTSTIVSVGAFDAHMGAVGGEIEPYFLSKVMGTSTCDMLVAPKVEVTDKSVAGICGQVDGSIIPSMIGFEAGQSAFGDVYSWFKNTISWSLKQSFATGFFDDEILEKFNQHIDKEILPNLNKAAAELPLHESDELAIDWLNGRRSPDANQELKCAIMGLNLGTDAPRLFKALVESTCFGAYAIIERFIEQGIKVEGLIGLGGVAKKSPFIMQMMADVTGMPIKIHKSDQTCAAGSAMFAATAAGVYHKVEDAMSSMGQGFETTYYPDLQKNEIYQIRYKKYKAFGDFIENGFR